MVRCVSEAAHQEGILMRVNARTLLRSSHDLILIVGAVIAIVMIVSKMVHNWKNPPQSLGMSSAAVMVAESQSHVSLIAFVRIAMRGEGRRIADAPRAGAGPEFRACFPFSLPARASLRLQARDLPQLPFGHRRTAFTSVKCVRKGKFTFGGGSDSAIDAGFGAGCGGVYRGYLGRGCDCWRSAGAIAVDAIRGSAARAGTGIHRAVRLPQR